MRELANVLIRKLSVVSRIGYNHEEFFTIILLGLLGYSDFAQPQTYAEIQQTRNNTWNGRNEYLSTCFNENMLIVYQTVNDSIFDSMHPNPRPDRTCKAEKLSVH